MKTYSLYINDGKSDYSDFLKTIEVENFDNIPLLECLRKDSEGNLTGNYYVVQENLEDALALFGIDKGVIDKEYSYNDSYLFLVDE